MEGQKDYVEVVQPNGKVLFYRVGTQCLFSGYITISMKNREIGTFMIVDGIKDGPYDIRDNSGRIVEKGELKNGSARTHGSFFTEITYTEKGSCERFYECNKRKKKSVYDLDGTLLEETLYEEVLNDVTGDREILPIKICEYKKDGFMKVYDFEGLGFFEEFDDFIIKRDITKGGESNGNYSIELKTPENTVLSGSRYNGRFQRHGWTFMFKGVSHSAVYIADKDYWAIGQVDSFNHLQGNGFTIEIGKYIQINEGFFVDSKLHGKGITYQENTTLSSDFFRNGKIDGEGEMVTRKTKTLTLKGAYNNGLKNGHFILTQKSDKSDNSYSMSMTFQDDILHGPTISPDFSSNTTVVVNYENGKCIGGMVLRGVSMRITENFLLLTFNCNGDNIALEDIEKVRTFLKRDRYSSVVYSKETLTWIDFLNRSSEHEHEPESKVDEDDFSLK